MAAAAFRVGERLAGRFVVQAESTRGTLGDFARVHDERTGVDVVLRSPYPELLPDAASRAAFHERMAAARALGHANLVRVYDVVSDGERELVACQHVPGRTLAGLSSSGALGWEAARPIIGQVAAAIAHAHHAGLLLGDVRPGAAVLVADTVKLQSVGAALALPRDGLLAALAGMPEREHLAPELRGGAPGLDARIDVYSFAALALTLAYGRGLAEARSALDLPLPTGVQVLLERALDADPDGRQPSVEVLLAALDRAAESARPRRGPVTLPRSITSPGIGGSVLPPARPATQPTLPVPGLARRLDGDAPVENLAAEVSRMLDTTRQVSVAEIEYHRALSARPDPPLRPRGASSDDVETIEVGPVLAGAPLPAEAPAAAAEARTVVAAPPRSRAPIDDGEAAPMEISGDDLDVVSELVADAEEASPAPAGRPSAELATAPFPRAEPEAASAETDFSSLLDDDDGTAVVAPMIVDEGAGEDAERADDAALATEGADEAEDGSVITPPPPPAPRRDGEPPDDPALDEEGTPLHAAFAAALQHVGPRVTRLPTPPAGYPVDPPLGALSPSLPPITEAPRPEAEGAVSGAREDGTNEPEVDERDTTRPYQPAQLIDEHPAWHDEATPAAEPQAPPSAMAVPALPDAPVIVAKPAAPVEAKAARRAPTDPRVVAARPRRRASLAGVPLVALVLLGGVAGALVGLGGLFRGRETAPARIEPPAALAPAAAPQPVADAAAEPEGAAVRSAAVVIEPRSPDAGPAPSGTSPTTKPEPAPAAVPMVAVRSAKGRGFRIDSHEFPGAGKLPRTGVTLDEARALCAARGARLCTAREFETACRGESGASYPYGQSYEANVCNTSDGKVEPAGTFTDCVSHFGAYDMSGNVAEWTDKGIVKGGAVGEGNPAGRCSHEARTTEASSPRIGFRCCSDLPAE